MSSPNKRPTKKSTKKLTLERTTLRALEAKDLGRIAGGLPKSRGRGTVGGDF